MASGKGKSEGRGKVSSNPRDGAPSAASGKGGPAGAHQGGAPRGASRLDPSHREQRRKEDRHGKPKS